MTLFVEFLFVDLWGALVVNVTLLLAYNYGANLILFRCTLGHWPTFRELWRATPPEIEAEI